MSPRFLSVFLLSLTAPLVAALAQQPAQRPQQLPEKSADPQAAYTLSTGTRIVLTDVTVTDAKGNVVHNIPASAFHISDNNQPQTVKTFEEHNNAPIRIDSLPTSTSGVYSNEYLKHLPPVLNIIVLDSSRLEMVDQMYLRYELHQFLKKLPPDVPFAVYARSGDETLLVQNFTADHALLSAAVDKSIPHMRVLGADFRNSTSTLRQIAQQLAQVPGRKNVIWFAGGRTETVEPDPTARHCEADGCYHRIYSDLQAARIAIYPVDARGINLYAENHIRMEDAAVATGGHAYFNNNDLDHITSRIIETDNSFYTITYAPENFNPNRQWHKVHVTLDVPGYNLSYRTGYFADKRSATPPPDSAPGNEKLAAIPANFRIPPITFSASIVPADAPPDPTGPFVMLKTTEAPAKNTIPYIIRYSIPADSFVTHTDNGLPTAAFEVAAIAFDQNGEKVGLRGDQVSAHFPQDDPHKPIRIQQAINLKPGELYFYIAVWDAANGRVGTLQIPANVPKPSKH